MRKEELEKMLSDLGEGAEAARSGLADEIKGQIPQRLLRHRGMDTINIIIDLRISKLAAAAVIIITIVLWASLFGGSGGGDNIYQDGKLLVQYCLGGGNRANFPAIRTRYEYLVSKGKEAGYYGDNIDVKDGNAVVLQWKLSDGRYRVIFSDMREETVEAEELIALQGRMLQKKKGR